MIATISKDHHFSAAHRLDHLPAEHQCHRLHGHNYLVRVEIAGRVAPDGMVLDYGLLAPLWRYIDDELDHRYLNDVISFPTTAEHLAHWLRDRACALLPGLAGPDAGYQVRVGVSETPRTWAWT